MTRKAAQVAVFALLFALPAAAEVIDRIAALVERQVITRSEVDQVVGLRIFARNADESEDAYRRRVLDAMIAQTLRYRDVERFGAEDVPADSIEARLREVKQRFPSETAFAAALREVQLTEDEVRTIIKRQLQVEAYIEERFSPLIFVSLDEIERYYSETWGPQRRERGLPLLPLGEVREEIRTLLKAERLQQEIDRWTAQLRATANVDVYVYR